MIKALVVTDSRRVYKRFIELNDLSPELYPWIHQTQQVFGYHECFMFMLFGSQNVLKLDDYAYVNTHDIQTIYV